MTAYATMSTQQLEEELTRLRAEHATFQAKGLSLNMARGKPSAAQLDLSMPMLDELRADVRAIAEDGTDCRNYGVLDGLPEAKRLMATMLDDNADNVIVFGNASLTIMYDTMARCFQFGTCGSRPWNDYDVVKWICPVPGYDRHFAITEAFGAQMIPVRLTATGPDMDEVERIAASDERVKGMWCVPKYSNPSGITYSDDTVRRLAFMECAADDFRIFWDNAYCVHHLYDEANEQDHLLDIGRTCKEAGHADRAFKFASTSKVTFPGAGVAAMAASPANIADIKQHISVQMIGHDKLNQLRHVRFLRDASGIALHMSKHAAIMRPKFELVLQALDRELESIGECFWERPRGGYFVSFNAPHGCAKRTVELARQAGVCLTGAGATWPYGNDPADSNIRIAPSLPPLDELKEAMDVFCCCVKLAYAERLLGV
ncbi:aminotransferase class I/II-fold pyridoxal phosphate-dependent enzyme [Adlercreutzia sp. ZJ141]|uniref:aminotransferase class I/II-fold pyridoxal phosphate-dependent enzyme n=1 Tax=Adlercreutzia sp. ZJ141 TaxID=2709406 RepID=UPI0013EC6473|nr:aminotransferase class I/II-fold pyridoxal phosphate-dependent enzyme [Adlercreutzia sp. ZJ141]